MVEATGLGLFLYRPLAWCFLREMKYLSILMVGVALLVSGCGGYTGTKVEYLGGLKTETPYLNGKKHGSQIQYYIRDGSKLSETYIRDGSKFKETPLCERQETWHGY